MFEFLKLAWDALVLRDSMRKGEMTAGVWGAALLFLAVLMCIAIPTIVYLDRHPDAPGSVLIYPAIAVGLLLIVYFWLSIRWRLRLNRQSGNIDA
jgi:hypothetical protein